MDELVDALEALAARGSPRGAASVLAAARAAQLAPAQLPLPPADGPAPAPLPLPPDGPAPAPLVPPRPGVDLRPRAGLRRRPLVWLAAAAAVVLTGSVIAWTRAHRSTVVSTGPAAAGPIDATVLSADAAGIVLTDPNTGRTEHIAACEDCLWLMALDRAHVFGTKGVPGRQSAARQLHLVDATSGTDRVLGDGEFVFPAPDARSVYVMSDNFRTVTQWSRDGDRIGGPWSVPAGFTLTETARRAVAGGILLQSDENATGHTLEVWNPTTGAVRAIGRSYLVIDTYTPPGSTHSLIAWLPTFGPCDGRCVAVSDSATGATRQIAGPPGHFGFMGGGGFSPDGSTLAAFASNVALSGVPSNPSADLAIIDLAHRDQVRVIEQSRVQIGEPHGSAAWTPDGKWLFFGGLDNQLRLYRNGDRSARTTTLPASYDLTIVR